MANEKIQIDVLVEAAKSASTVKELKKAMKDLRDAALEVGQDGGESFTRINKAIAGAKDRVDDINEAVRSMDPGAKAGAFISLGQSMAGAFSIATGAAGLFGAKQEYVQQALLKVQSAIAILQGVQAIADAKRDLGLVRGLALRGAEAAQLKISTALESKSVIVRGAATVAQALLNKTMLANPIFLIIGALGALVGAFAIFNSASQDSIAQSEALSKAYEKELESIKKLGDAKIAAAEFEQKLNKIRGASAAQQLADEKKVLDQKIANVKGELAVNKYLIDEKTKALSDLKDEELEKAKEEIADARKKNSQLLADFVAFNRDKAIAVEQYAADAKKKRDDEAKKEKDEADKKAKESSDKAKQYNDQRLKDNQQLQNQIADLNNAAIQDEEKREQNKLKLDTERKKKEVDNLKADAQLKVAAKAKIDEDAARQSNEIIIKYAEENSRTRLEAELALLEAEGQSTLAKQIEIAKLERDVIVNSTKTTQEEKLKALAEYDLKEKELFVDSLKSLEQQIKDNSATARLSKLTEYQQQLADLQKSRDEQLKVIDDAIKKEVEIATAQGVNPNDAKLAAEKKYLSDRELINDEYRKKQSELDKAETDKRIANFQNEFNGYAQAAQTTLTAIGDLYNARDEREKQAMEEKQEATAAAYDAQIATTTAAYDTEIASAKSAGLNTEALEKKKANAVKQAEYEKALAIYNQKKQQEVLEKKAFERNKKLQIAQALISGAVGAVNALSATPAPIMPIISMALATLTTVAAIAKINSTKFEGGGSVLQPPAVPNISADSITTAGEKVQSNIDTSSVAFNTSPITKTGDTLRANEKKQETLKVVVLQSDIADANANVARIENKNSF
ncbi:MAG TPA: hypothetical protein VF868_15225 [Bacteroidia bacterium]|jgi:hypothetical protein